MSNKEKEAQNLILTEIEKSHKLLMDHLNKFCNDTGATSIPIVYIKTSIDILLDGYRTGADDSKPKE